MTAHSARVHLLILILLSGLVIGFNLGSSSLHNQDEAMHAVIAREAVTQGNWLLLTYNDSPYFNKPPLRIWLTALTFQVAGINEWSVRLWSAISGLGTVLTLYLVGRRLWGERTAFLSSLILLTSHQYIYNHCVRTGETDSMLIFCWTCALLLLQLSVEERNRRLLYLAAAFLGLCGMVKHLGFVPIVLSIAIGYVVLAGVWRVFPLRTWGLGLGIVFAVALPWHLLIWSLEGKAFVQRYLLGEVVEKRLEAKGGGPALLPSGNWASILTMARGFFPWSCLLPFAFVGAFGRAHFRRRWLMPVLWLLVAVGTTVISGRKFSWYVIPAFPAAAILVAGLIDRFLDEASGAWTRASVLLGGLLALASITNAATHNPFEAMAREAMLGVHFLGRLRSPESSLFSALALIVVLGALATLAYRLLGRNNDSIKAQRDFRTLFATAILALALYTVVVPLRFSRTTSPLHEIALASEAHLAEGETLNIRLPRRKSRYPRFKFYLGDRNLRIMRATELTPDAIPGELLLTDVATLEQIREAVPELALPDRPLAQAKGLLLLRLPGE